MKDFPTFAFKSTGLYSKFATVLFTLTHQLLSFFDSGNNSPIKMEISQPNPRFDMFLDMILKYMKQLPLMTLVDSLQLEQVTNLADSQGKYTS